MTPGKILLMFGTFWVLVVALLPHIVWLVGWLISLPTKAHLRYAPFGWAALALVSSVVMILSCGYCFGRWNLKVKEYVYANQNIPAAFDGLRIVHISDLHLNTFDDRPEQLDRFVAEINAQKPDLICFTGDLVTTGRKEAEPYTEVLSSLSAKYGVFSILGNHDFLIYERSFASEQERNAALVDLAAYQTNTLGWHLLRNSSCRIEAPDGSVLTIIGVDNKNCSDQGFKTIDKGNLQEAMAGTEGFRILLSHDPGHWDSEVLSETDIPLTLSGHTHSAQVRLFGWTPASMMFLRSYGRYNENGQTLFVNPGLGCTVPFRIGAHPEISVIILRIA